MPTHWAPGLRCLVPLAFLWTCSTALPAGGIAVERIAAELPPGFHIQGPDDDMNCSATDNTRAAFAVMTPEMRAAQHEQMGAQYWKNWDDSLLAAEADAWEEGDREMMEGVRDLHDQMDQLQAALRSQAGGTQEIEDEDERKLTSLRLEFTGSNQGRECALSLYTTLPAPGPQIVTDFRLGVYTADLLDFQRKLASGTVPDLFAMDETPRRNFWGACDQTMDCPAPQLVLEHADMRQVSGSFRYPVRRHLVNGEPVDHCYPPGSPIERCSIEHSTVTGFFNAASQMGASGNQSLDAAIRSERFLWDQSSPAERFMPGARIDLKGKPSPIEVERTQR